MATAGLIIGYCGLILGLAGLGWVLTREGETTAKDVSNASVEPEPAAAVSEDVERAETKSIGSSNAIANRNAVEVRLPKPWIALDADGWSILKPAADTRIVFVSSSDGDDTIELVLGSSEHTLTLNGEQQTFDAEKVTSFQIDGGRGNDTLRVTGTDEDDVLRAFPSLVLLDGGDYSVVARDMEDVSVDGADGQDAAVQYDSDKDDLLDGVYRPGRKHAPGCRHAHLNSDPWKRFESQIKKYRR